MNRMSVNFSFLENWYVFVRKRIDMRMIIKLHRMFTTLFMICLSYCRVSFWRVVFCHVVHKIFFLFFSWTQRRNEVRRRPGQEASLAPPRLKLRSFESKCTVLKKAYLWHGYDVSALALRPSPGLRWQQWLMAMWFCLEPFVASANP